MAPLWIVGGAGLHDSLYCCMLVNLGGMHLYPVLGADYIRHASPGCRRGTSAVWGGRIAAKWSILHVAVDIDNPCTSIPTSLESTRFSLQRSGVLPFLFNFAVLRIDGIEQLTCLQTIMIFLGISKIGFTPHNFGAPRTHQLRHCL